ncbi:hypothetical protein M378DRAFT_14465 [Amanita muscaria Koide BX008]|uniref:Nephrocystin 3-like N-terminal domain-containing protein n=1 Tax=Amanita muscaria (strain Koide BX008) TaxID=946122 RepID=A0A0C2WF69_AMAMK|nr:hypothetical protein M378DRAFT_14465 [Amanita muscaria Koide BX008]
MLSSASSASSQQLLQSLQTNNGLNGDGSNNTVNSGNSQVATAEGEDVELDRLLDRHASKDALRNSFRSHAECHPNTRTTIRNGIGCWLDESVSKKSPLLWLNGPAVVGKSVIAKAVSGFHDQIPGSWLASLKSSDSLQTSQIEEQYNLLITQPLKSTTTLKCRPVMVIDGVDECTDEGKLGRFLRVLVQAGEGGDMPVRFIICSRPEPRIHAILGGNRDVNPARDGPEPQLPMQILEVPSFVLNVTITIWLGFGQAVSLGLFRSIRTFGIRQLFQDTRKYGIFHLFRLIGRYGASELIELYSKVFGFPGSLIALAGALLLLSASDRPAHLPIPIERRRGFLQDVCELYRPIRLDVDKDSSLPSSDGLIDTFDKIYPHPPSDISDLVKASGGQFLYASTIVRLLDNPRFSPKRILEMARRSSLPTSDLDELYKAILKWAQEGNPDYQFVKGSLAILVFFAGNVHFPTVQKKFPVVEFLLGLEKGELNTEYETMRDAFRPQHSSWEIRGIRQRLSSVFPRISTGP